MLELSISQLWRTGPEWLRLDKPIPSDSISAPMPELCLPELRACGKLSRNVLAIEGRPTIGEAMSCEDFSTLQSHSARPESSEPLQSQRNMFESSIMLTPQEIATAEWHWIVHTQKELVLQKNFGVLKNQFVLFLDDTGLWRCGGRLQNADIPFAAKHPILLPRKHPFTALVVRKAHQHVSHNGVKETLTEVRRMY